MFRNYFKVTIRNIIKNKAFSLINIIGLSIGLTCSIIIFLFVQNEFSYDKFHDRSDDIYRIIRGGESKSESYAGSPAPLGPHLLEHLPKIDSYLRFGRSSWNNKNLITSKHGSFYESGFFLTDANFFEFFSFKLLKGNPRTALEKPNSVVISQSMAKKYFGYIDPIGQTLSFDKKLDFEITGVMEDPPPNTHLSFNFLAPFSMLNDFFSEGRLESWNEFNYYTYIRLQHNVLIIDFEDSFNNFITKFYDDQNEIEQFKGYNFQPLSDIHFEIVRYNPKPAFEVKYIYIFLAISLIILLIACINYMNLSIAGSIRRMKEIGIRKISGATRIKLIHQFMGETTLITFFSLFISLILLYCFIPLLNRFLNFHISFELICNSSLFVLPTIVIVVALISGLYPALYFSSYNPVKVLKPGFGDKKRRMIFQNGMIILQFFISISLISSALLIYRQLSFIHAKDYGLNKDLIINIPLYDVETRKKSGLLKSEFEKNTNIVSVSANRFLPSRGTWNQSTYWEGMQKDDSRSMWLFTVDEDFLETFEIDLVSGRNFSSDFNLDKTRGYLINQAAVKALDWDAPIDKDFSAMGSNNMGKVIGVVKDFHFRSMHFQIDPCCIVLLPHRFDQLSLKLREENIQTTIKSIQQTWETLIKDIPFEYKFISDDYYQMYKSEQFSSKLITIFTGISLFLSCLGLFGLISLSTKQRTKEIGIRKVLGASGKYIYLILIREYLKLILISFILALPIVFYVMNKWLQNFVYKKPISIWIFVVSGTITLVITLLAVSYHTSKAIKCNPVVSLKYE